MSNLAEMERNTLMQIQLEGIVIRKAKKLYTGREKGTTESKDEVLAKYPKVIYYLKNLIRLHQKKQEFCVVVQKTLFKK